VTAFDKPTAPNEECRHPRASHRHGTYACYVLDKCRCDECRPVAVAYRREEDRRNLYRKYATDDRFEPFVDVAPARDHIKALQAAGLGWKQVARRAHIGSTVVYGMMYGRPDRNGGKPVQHIRRDTLARILSVPIPAPEALMPGAHVDATPTANRIKALATMGYGQSAVAREAGLDEQRIRKALKGERTTVRTHVAVKDAFARLWRGRRTSDEWRAKIAASRAHRQAREAGWPSPLDLDEDGYLIEDEPVEQDQRGADLDEFMFLVRSGENPARAAQRLGVGVNAIERAAGRKGRRDVLDVLSREGRAA